MVSEVIDERTDSIDESDLDQTDEEEDPLFGKFENDKELGMLLSPKKKKRKSEDNTKISGSASSLKSGEFDKLDPLPVQKKKRFDILNQLQANMKSPLDKELGFSINKAMQYDAKEVLGSRDFGKLLGSVKREREIANILDSAESDEMQKKDLIENIRKWVQLNVWDGFLNAEVDSVKIHARWIQNLEKYIREIVRENNDQFEEIKILKTIKKDAFYCKFKCFEGKGITSTKYIHRLSMLHGYNIKYLLESLDKHYIESFPSDATITGEYSLEKVLNSLGFDMQLFSNQQKMDSLKPVEKRFDSKRDGPAGGSALQVMKIIKLLDNKAFCGKCTTEEILSVLILMFSDDDVNKDGRRFYYNHRELTASEILRVKMEQYKDHVDTVNILLQKLFSLNCSDLWFQFIKTLAFENQQNILFVFKLILFFLKENDVGDDVSVEIDINGMKNLDDVFTALFCYIKELSYKKFKLSNEHLLAIVLMKTELLKISIILLEPEILRRERTFDGKVDSSRSKLNKIRVLLIKIKNTYFSEYQNYNPVVPKCKRVLDFVYHQITGVEPEYFFSDNDLTEHDAEELNSFI